jgi:hypothetical protein
MPAADGPNDDSQHTDPPGHGRELLDCRTVDGSLVIELSGNPAAWIRSDTFIELGAAEADARPGKTRSFE